MHRERIGILGGAFDPIHQGHLACAHYCLQHYALDHIRFVPTRQPVLKKMCAAHPWQRAAMVALAISNEKKFYLDTSELISDQPSYALLTLQRLQLTFPAAEFFWILGKDAYADFTRWYQWQKIAEHCHLLVVDRHSIAEQLKENDAVRACFQQAGHEVLPVPMPPLDLASTTIRAAIAAHETAIPASVWRFIVENNLYTQHPCRR